MLRTKGLLFACAVTAASLTVAGMVLAHKTQPGPGLPPPGGGYNGPGDTVPPTTGGGGPLCPALCPTTFTVPGCALPDPCDAPIPHVATLNAIFGTCGFVSPTYRAHQFDFTYADWIALDQQITNMQVIPDANGNVTICTGVVANIQEVYVLESQRINGGGPDGACAQRFPQVRARVWVADGAHGGLPPTTTPPDCGKERLFTGVFTKLVHCLAPPPNCVEAQVFITFNVTCMRQAILWWQTNYGDNCAGSSANQFALQCSTWLFDIGMLTCQLSSTEN